MFRTTRFDNQSSTGALQVGAQYPTPLLTQGDISCIRLIATTLNITTLNATTLNVTGTATVGTLHTTGLSNLDGDVSMGANASVVGKLTAGSITAGPDISFDITPNVWASLNTVGGTGGVKILEMPQPFYAPMIYYITAVYTPVDSQSNFTVPANTKLWVGVDGINLRGGVIHSYAGSGIPLNGFVDKVDATQYLPYAYIVPNPDLLDEDEDPLTETPILVSSIIGTGGDGYSAIYLITDNEVALTNGHGTLTINIWFNLCYMHT